MLSVVKMTEIVLPKMVAKKKGLILNVSSGSGLRPVPLLALYAASKQFVDSFSRAVSVECRSKGVTVQCVMPFFVTTKLSTFTKTNILIPSPDDYVRNTLKTVGRNDRTFGCLSHAIQGETVMWLPDFLHFAIFGWMLGRMRKRRLAAKKRKM